MSLDTAVSLEFIGWTAWMMEWLQITNSEESKGQFQGVNFIFSSRNINISRPTESRDRNQITKECLEVWCNCFSLQLAGTEYREAQNDFRAPRYPDWRAGHPTLVSCIHTKRFPLCLKCHHKKYPWYKTAPLKFPNRKSSVIETVIYSPIKYQITILWNRLNVTSLEPVFLNMRSLYSVHKRRTDGWTWLSFRTCARLSAFLSVPLSVRMHISTGNSMDGFWSNLMWTLYQSSIFWFSMISHNKVVEARLALQPKRSIITIVTTADATVMVVGIVTVGTMVKLE